MSIGIIRRAKRFIRTVESTAKAVPEIKAKLAANETILRQMASRTNQLKPKPEPLPPVRFLSLPDEVKLECPICATPTVKWISAYPSNDPKFRMAAVLYCGTCGSGHVPDADTLIAGYYASEYGTSNRKDRDIPPTEYFRDIHNPRLTKYFGRANAQIESLSHAGATFGRVLDYGSGPGYLLYASEAAEKYAVEFDSASDKYLNYMGATKLKPDELPPNYFDVIVASHVVEHFTSTTLNDCLRAMLAALKSDGLLLVEVPHGGHTYTRLTARQDPHTLFFTPDGIRRAMRNAGAHVLREYCRAASEGAPSPHQVYYPDSADVFASTRRGGITIIARKQAV